MTHASGKANGTRQAQPSFETRYLWQADLVCPVGSPPIRGGAVLTRGGRVEALGLPEEILSPGQVVQERGFGRAILIPGLVNAHTHLELSGARIEPAPMGEWIVGLVRETRGWPPHLFLSSSSLGVAASFEVGVTCVGDISASGHSRRIMSDLGMKGIVFKEVLGLLSAEADKIVESRVLGDAVPDTSALRFGVSPHAPYTTSLCLYRSALKAARENGWPTVTHLAESPEEARFINGGDGPLAEMHEALGSPTVDFESANSSPVRYLSDGGALAGIDLAVHCNQTDEADWALLAEAGVCVCLCPRSAVHLGHPFADAAGMRLAGLNLCLGTDSRASSPSLSVLEEAAALWEADPELSPEVLLEMCTVAGAEVLGFRQEGVGRIVPGGVADFAVVEPPPGKDEPELADIFHPAARVRTTVSDGVIRFERGD
ncbi:MAG: amidohydrolase family protein [Nitrospinaceae bacterium]|jgi:aminodeoxyfutalosine deaminase|nr:amidohydrolase family protein [Nitrospinaceae bacterium]MBT3434785.1 amidohydrolase family protein [Nitrospinaceae bacterium]MBT3820960.1 amidohydrolase family protein [Nitrospinaceae bacterium]MBT4094742.1 amidohydrolase family protein [Nitrospinaceae bacterium]MBT4432484.1 amidohydrolase family protein [Nitrospinaceae bacterium]